MILSRILTPCIASIVLTCSVYAQPRLNVQAEMDWGTIVPNGPASVQQRVQTRLSLKNIGDATLRIRAVRPSCGCVTAPLERDSIAPNEEVFIDVTMNMPVANGPLRKTLTIHTNEPFDSMHVVALKAELVRPIQLSSSFVPFNKSRVGELAEGEITITSFASHDVQVAIASLADGLTVSSQSPVMITKGKPETIRLIFRPSITGSYQVDLEIRTSYPGYEVIPISGFGVADARLER